MPEVASAPLKLTVSGFRYHPLPSGARSAAALTEGTVASYLSATDVDAVFPATSRQPAATATDPLSGPEYVGWSHDAMPEVASAPLTLSPTGWLYQPFASGARPGAAALTCGGVLSIFSVTCPVAVPPWLVAVQLYVAVPSV